MTSPTTSGVGSCTVSSPLPIPACNKQVMQPSTPLDVSSRGSPQLGHLGVSLLNGTLGIRVKSHVKIKPASGVTFGSRLRRGTQPGLTSAKSPVNENSGG